MEGVGLPNRSRRWFLGLLCVGGVALTSCVKLEWRSTYGYGGTSAEGVDGQGYGEYGYGGYRRGDG